MSQQLARLLHGTAEHTGQRGVTTDLSSASSSVSVVVLKLNYFAGLVRLTCLSTFVTAFRIRTGDEKCSYWTELKWNKLLYPTPHSASATELRVSSSTGFQFARSLSSCTRQNPLFTYITIVWHILTLLYSGLRWHFRRRSFQRQRSGTQCHQTVDLLSLSALLNVFKKTETFDSAWIWTIGLYSLPLCALHSLDAIQTRFVWTIDWQSRKGCHSQNCQKAQSTTNCTTSQHSFEMFLEDTFGHIGASISPNFLNVPAAKQMHANGCPNYFQALSDF